MNKLKIILQSKIFYLIVFLISLIYVFVYNSFTYNSKITGNEATFTITNIDYNDKYIIDLDFFGEKVIGYFYLNEFDFACGDVVLISFKDVDIIKNTLPNTFNYKKYLYHNHIFKVIEISDVKLISSNNNLIFFIKNYIINRVKDIDNSNFLLAFLFDYSYDDDSYQKAGISHLFAISGLHVSFLLLFLKKIFGRHQKICFVCCFFFLVTYLVILDFSISLFRCLLFMFLILINNKLNLNIEKPFLLVFAFSVLLFIDPFYIFNLGFLFSFIITFFLLLFGVNNKNYLKILFYNSIICFFASFPIVINNFFEVNITSIFNNLICVPFVSFVILPLSFLTIFFPFISFVLNFFIDLFNLFVNFSNSHFMFNVIFCKQSLLYIFIYYVSMTFAFRCKKLWAFTIFSFIIILWYIWPFSYNNKIIFADVGEGDSSIVQVNDSVNIIDTGGIYIKDDSKYTYKLSKTLISYLKSIGIRKVDNLFLTHGDRDHIKDASYLISNFKVLNVYFNNNIISNYEMDVIMSCKDSDTNYFFMKANDYVYGNNYYFTNLNYSESDNENEASLVLFFKYYNIKALFMGDAPKNVEDKIISKYELSDIELLKISHHGSKTSTSDFFVKSVNPNICIISAGLKNRYGHPNDEVLKRLDVCDVYRTDLDGSIEVLLNKKEYVVNTFKK